MLRGDDKYKRPIGVLFDTEEGRRFVGQLNLERGDLFDSNVVSIVDDRFVHIPDGGALHGRSEAGRVSLLDCVKGGTLGSTNWGDFGVHHGDMAFRYALFGKRHLAADEKAIRGIQFTLEGAESSVFIQDKFERFGHLHAPDEEVLEAIARTRPEYMKGDLVKGKAMVSYFTGHWDLVVRFETVLGTVHIGRSSAGITTRMGLATPTHAMRTSPITQSSASSRSCWSSYTPHRSCWNAVGIRRLLRWTVGTPLVDS